jgi:hypothetical protein
MEHKQKRGTLSDGTEVTVVLVDPEAFDAAGPEAPIFVHVTRDGEPQQGIARKGDVTWLDD